MLKEQGGPNCLCSVCLLEWKWRWVLFFSKRKWRKLIGKGCWAWKHLSFTMGCQLVTLLSVAGTDCPKAIFPATYTFIVPPLMKFMATPCSWQQARTLQSALCKGRGDVDQGEGLEITKLQTVVPTAQRTQLMTKLRTLPQLQQMMRKKTRKKQRWRYQTNKNKAKTRLSHLQLPKPVKTSNKAWEKTALVMRFLLNPTAAATQTRRNLTAPVLLLMTSTCTLLQSHSQRYHMDFQYPATHCYPQVCQVRGACWYYLILLSCSLFSSLCFKQIFCMTESWQLNVELICCKY